MTSLFRNNIFPLLMRRHIFLLAVCFYSTVLYCKRAEFFLRTSIINLVDAFFSQTYMFVYKNKTPHLYSWLTCAFVSYVHYMDSNRSQMGISNETQTFCFDENTISFHLHSIKSHAIGQHKTKRLLILCWRQSPISKKTHCSGKSNFSDQFSFKQQNSFSRHLGRKSRRNYNPVTQ